MMEILLMLYALLTLNTADLNNAIENDASLTEIEHLRQTNDCLRREIQVIRRNM